MTKKKNIKLAVVSVITITVLYSAFWFFNAWQIKKGLLDNGLVGDAKVSGFPLAYHVVAKDFKFSQMQLKSDILNNVTVEHLEGVYDVFSSRYVADLSKPLIFHNEVKNITVVVNFSEDSTMTTTRNKDGEFVTNYKGAGYNMTVKNSKTQKYFVYHVKNPIIALQFGKNKLALKSSDSGYETLSDQGDVLLSAQATKIDVQTDINDQGDIATAFAMEINDYLRGEKSSYIFDIIGDGKMQLMAKMQDSNRQLVEKSDIAFVGKLNLEKNPEGTMMNLLSEDNMQKIRPEMRKYYQRKAPAFNVNFVLDHFKYANSSYNILLNGQVATSLHEVFPSGKMTIKIAGFDNFVANMKRQFDAVNAINTQNPQQEEKVNKMLDYVKNLATKNVASTQDLLVFDLLRNQESHFTFQINHIEFSQIIEDIKQLYTKI